MAKSIYDAKLTTVKTETEARRAAGRAWTFERKTVGESLFDISIVLFFIIVTVTFAYPYWYTVLRSFSDFNTTSRLGLYLWIKDWSLAAWERMFAMGELSSSTVGVGKAYMNSIFRTVVGTPLTLIVTRVHSQNMTHIRV